MKKLLIALMLGPLTPAIAAPYFQTVVSNPFHPFTSLTAIFTSKAVFDGALAEVAAVYHKGDKNETLLPQFLLDAGIQPVSWALLELGAGGNKETGFVNAGLGVNLAPSLLGPVTQLLERAGGNYAAFGKYVVSPDGNGVKLSLSWKLNVISEGGFTPLTDYRAPPRYGVGYGWQF